MVSIFWQGLIENWEGIIAMCALLITFAQGLSIRRHNRISVKPFLSSHSHYHIEKNVFYFRFIVSNDGLGPAMVKNFSVYFRNNLLAENNAMKTQSEVVNIILNHYPKALLTHNVGACNRDAIITSKKDLLALDVAIKMSNSSDRSHLIKFLDDFDLTIEYESFYGGKNTLDTKSNSL